MLDDRDVMRLLVLDQPVQVRPHRVECVEGHHGAGQVHRSQEFGEVAGLVVLNPDLKLVQQAPAMFGGAEQVDPGAVGAAGPTGGLAVYGHGPQPVPGQRLGLLGRAPGTVSAHAGRRRPAGAPAAAPARPEQGPRVEPVQHDPDRLLIRRPVPAGQRVPRGAQPGQVCLAGPLDPLPDRGELVVPGRGERADRDRDQAGQRVDPPLRRPRVRQRFQPLPRPGGQVLAAGTGLDHARAHARQCHCGHATPRSCRPQRPT